MATLDLDDISKIYPGSRDRAVDHVSMKIEDGEIIALLGSSGCGKTSTLRMVAGFESVTEGTVKLGDRIVNNLKPAERNIAMAFEGYALYPPLKVRDNIAFSLLRDRTPRAEIDKRVGEISDMLELGPMMERYPPGLSGGQQQRVSLARALIRKAAIYLLDEPMSQLEPQLRALLRARIKDHLIANKMTTVIVTHDQTEAIALADRIAVMDNGLLQQFGTPEDLRERPSNLFVASFIGEPPMNLFSAEVAGGVLQVFDNEGAAAFTLPLRQGALPPGSRVMIGMRPHKLRVSEDLAGATLRGRVVTNHWLGDHSHVGVQVGGCFLIAVAGRHVVAPVGAEVGIIAPEDAVHVFDVANGQAIRHGLHDQATAA
ncbi:ABC transporter ATP-binding protein [Acidisoma sp. L85]|jgi:multiple sugar transport system ATP-binding protein|uniref:ABC transporter ATP-binding protein n=1 Tax=Acidisoma sp. L85 TaxID=1641850 RepID=UPI00131B4A03|nr:ABC transporter ATP-binding protein [Acidisoma sp. L85]